MLSKLVSAIAVLFLFVIIQNEKDSVVFKLKTTSDSELKIEFNIMYRRERTKKNKTDSYTHRYESFKLKCWIQNIFLRISSLLNHESSSNSCLYGVKIIMYYMFL